MPNPHFLEPLNQAFNRAAYRLLRQAGGAATGAATTALYEYARSRARQMAYGKRSYSKGRTSYGSRYRPSYRKKRYSRKNRSSMDGASAVPPPSQSERPRQPSTTCWQSRWCIRHGVMILIQVLVTWARLSGLLPILSSALTPHMHKSQAIAVRALLRTK
ncbi:hypothetical protein AtCopCV_gp2 [Acartia tonsa copepod circovirus]|uniref:hypothetical protein n=1 Tax=Acartia tonsa copepod circovirus TaxID=1168547 RepID=UPI0002AA4A1C|nr:hypothetical protein AtCopCV_gp2 [Acartia tonsa copepod circovirus]AFN42890.1 hypothetical protein AtCopCV_gp2 [Acartia tonsa copepod circovirus]